MKMFFETQWIASHINVGDDEAFLLISYNGLMNHEGWSDVRMSGVLFSEAEENAFVMDGLYTRKIINRVWTPLVLFLKFLDFEPVDTFSSAQSCRR